MTASDSPAILCLSHLGWDYVWQRPQHILSRLARHYPVIYVGEPTIASSPEPRLQLVATEANLTAWRPLIPDRPEAIGRWRETYVGLVRELLLDRAWIRRLDGELVSNRPLITWFYTPIPFYFLDRLPSQLVVYDVMDELANFKGAAPDLRERELRLLSCADLVFAGGRSLYEARKELHPSVHLFPSGVDKRHFARAQDPATEIPSEISHLPHPILGYYGVIDERIDLVLLEELARKHPEWSLVMLGPVAKIEVRELPYAPNIHYLGAQPYSRLPGYLKGFDVCLMPFAINEATRYISPTKALEYMAAHKPIVSTPVPDIVANWGDVVRIARGVTHFAQAVEQALVETRVQRPERIAEEERIVALNGWERIAAEMGALIDAALTRRTLPSKPAPR
ncbi:MAG: glycosyltransferase [Chloroflexota bacterium]|nr:glycosyltransferase [Chloroflexota bacterium]